MAVSAADLNQIRVDVLGTAVDKATTWTTIPPGNANTLNTPERIINRAINALNNSVVNALSGTNSFSDRFGTVVGVEQTDDKAAFESIGSNLIQAVAALMAGGGIVPPPGTLTLAFEFPDPIALNDFVEITLAEDCTIPADLDGGQYVGIPGAEDLRFQLTAEPSGDVIGEVHVAAGNVVTLSGIGGEIAAGTVLRMTAIDAGSGTMSPTAVISIVAEREAAPPPTAVGRFEFTQLAPDTTWTITHGLNEQVVNVQVTNGNTTMVPDVEYTSATVCTLTFAQPRNGKAVVRR